jgi:hypothetical protein
MELMKFRLFVTPIYTLSGKKKLYSLGDMAYGEWLVFKKNQPYAYLNVLEYKGDALKKREIEDLETYLEQKLQKLDSSLSLWQHFVGIKSFKTDKEIVELSKMDVEDIIN